MQQTLIGGRESVLRQLPLSDPGEVMAAERQGFVPPPIATEELQMDRFFRVFMRDGVEQFPDGDFNAQFLAQFARKAFLKRFGRMALATGKFPQAAQMILWTPLRDKEQAVAEDQAGGNFHRIANAEL